MHRFKTDQRIAWARLANRCEPYLDIESIIQLARQFQGRWSPPVRFFLIAVRGRMPRRGHFCLWAPRRSCWSNWATNSRRGGSPAGRRGRAVGGRHAENAEEAGPSPRNWATRSSRRPWAAAGEACASLTRPTGWMKRSHKRSGPAPPSAWPMYFSKSSSSGHAISRCNSWAISTVTSFTSLNATARSTTPSEGRGDRGSP